MDKKVETLIEELAELARETIEAAEDAKISIDEVVEIGQDIGDVVAAIQSLLPHDEERKARRKARRAARKAAREARRAQA